MVANLHVDTDQRETLLPSTSDLTKADKQVVKEFFLRLKTIYGPAKYRAQFGDDPESEKLAMMEWAEDIAQFTSHRLRQLLDIAKDHAGPDSWINVNEILYGPEFDWHEGMSRQEHMGLTDRAYGDWVSSERERMDRVTPEAFANYINDCNDLRLTSNERKRLPGSH